MERRQADRRAPGWVRPGEERYGGRGGVAASAQDGGSDEKQERRVTQLGHSWRRSPMLQHNTNRGTWQGAKPVAWRASVFDAVAGRFRFTRSPPPFPTR